MELDILDGLNKAQCEAVQSVDGPVLIVAGPGSGKTRVITHRVAYLTRVCKVSPYSILAVTFTNKAASEMQSRVLNLVPGSAGSLSVSTFHAFCSRLLHVEGDKIGLESFTIYDDTDQMKLIKQAIEDAEIDPRRFPKRAIQSAISKAKSLLIDSHEYSMRSANYFEQIVARIYGRYENLLEKNQAVDFDDLLLRTVQLFRTVPSVLEKYQERFVHIMIDEFQDTNVAQYELAKLLAERNKNICVVGDPDQSIYSWRNADLRNIMSFQEDYINVKVVHLEENYRSTQNILNAAKSLISSNQIRLDKDIWTSKGRGRPITMHEAYNESEEAEFVLRQVDDMVTDDGMDLRDIAVMYRTNAQSRAFEEECLKHKIKYKLVGGVRFYQRREIKDIVSYLRILENHRDDIGLERIINIPPRGIGQKSVERIIQWSLVKGISVYEALTHIAQHSDVSSHESGITVRATKSVANLIEILNELDGMRTDLKVGDLFNHLLEKVGYRDYVRNTFDDWEDRWENIEELRAIARDEFGELTPADGFTAFLERLALVSDIDEWDQQDDALTLITLHQAKGLEFPVVFITGMEEGLLPHSRSMETPEELEEERRLCYVGVTRAREKLYFLRSFRRGMMGTSGPTLPSRFLSEIPDELFLSSSQKKEKQQESPRREISQAVDDSPSFNTGDKVKHSVFGEGIVVNCVPSGQDHEVTVAFTGGAGVKRLLSSFAKLEINK